MVSIEALAVDDPRAHRLLAEYFQSREIGFAHQNVVYTTTFPAPSVFTPPAGVFVVLVDDGAGEEAHARDDAGQDSAADVGCGGIRRIADDERGIRYEVKHLYLTPQTRGRGWGRLLLDDLERRAREWGAQTLVLDTHHSLEAAAGLYRASGFVEIERFNDNPNATRWYAKTLSRD